MGIHISICIFNTNSLISGDINEDGTAPEDQTRPLGLVVVRGPLLLLISPVDGSEEIANPFIAQEEEI